MKYIAHKDGEREQTIKEHLIGTATLAAILLNLLFSLKDKN